LPLAVDERIKVLFHDGGRCTVATAKVVKHELMPRHVVQIVFEDQHARAEGGSRPLRASTAAEDRPELAEIATA
jgi:hypothetical protein